MATIDWLSQTPRRRGRSIALVVLALLLVSGGTTLSFYVESLWFAALGFGDVFFVSLRLQAWVFLAFALVTFAILYAAFVVLKPARLGDLGGGTIIVNGQPVRVPIEPVMRLLGLGAATVVAVLTGLAMAAQWRIFALYWNSGMDSLGESATAAAAPDPIFGRPLAFYLFTLPAWELASGWLMTLAVVACAAALAYAGLSGGTRVLEGRRRLASQDVSLRGVSATFGFVLLAFAIRIYLSRFSLIYVDQSLFSGVGYTDAHVTINGMAIVALLTAVGAVVAWIGAVMRPHITTLIAAVAPAVVCYVIVNVAGWYVSSFIVGPNQLVRESPYITHNIELTRRAFALDRIEQRDFAAEPGIAAVDAPRNRETLENIRLWDWRALQDTLRQIQEIRTYYDFPDIDIDRYEIDGTVRQVMLAVRELNVDRLPESSRTWINQRLIYTHGYGITMNRVNGFTPEGLPELIVSNMPVQSTNPGITVTRPEIYFGELTNSDVYVKTRQQEFDYPQGDTNSVSSYEGAGGILLGGFLRRTIIALDRGDLTRLPFSDDITPESRLLMRRNIRDRVSELAPFLTLDPDPYIVLTKDGRLVWMMDAYTTSASYPYARHYRLGGRRINYMRNSAKVTIDAYDGTVAFYVYDAEDPIIAAYRGVFPTLFRAREDMPEDLRSHVRYPELMLELQAAVYGIYHITEPSVFYNREDVWSVASEVGFNERREHATQVMEPNFVLMKLPGEDSLEFVEMLPFTPQNRNNLIGWIAGRSDEPNYGSSLVFHFPQNRLVDGPLQIEARIDQNPQLSAQLSLWNQQGSNVRRGGLIVIPVGRALLYAEPIYLQAERSPMPELRIVVLALQDRLAYGPTFEAALSSLFGGEAPTLGSAAGRLVPPGRPSAPTPIPGVVPPESGTSTSNDDLISQAARDLEEYQRLTAEGRLGEAGQRLEALKRKLEELKSRSR
ncbi:MAG: UPF0182 family protein [Acidimicrobiia bacterium]|nr:UPF0182 family protein [Acidimicrobiia bacterium]